MRNDAAVREISSVSLSEIAIKNARGKLTFDDYYPTPRNMLSTFLICRFTTLIRSTGR
jgi:hypothetical protein